MELKLIAYHKTWNEVFYLRGYNLFGGGQIQLFYTDEDGCRSSTSVALSDLKIEMCLDSKEWIEVEIK